jgi:hypothetical protein
LPRLALNCDPPDLCLLSSWNYRREPLVPGSNFVFKEKAYAYMHRKLLEGNGCKKQYLTVLISR